MHYEPKVSTGSLREKLIVRSSSRRSSMRNTISRALKNTFGIGDKNDDFKLTSSRESLPTTSSIQPSSSSEGSTSYFTTQSSGFCSMTHLPPPVQKKSTHYASSLMSQSMYEPRSSSSPKDVFRRHGSRSSAFPVYEDFDDSQSIVSTASTSRFITAHPRRVKKHCLHSFLLSPVRLRKREVTNTDAVEAGFVPPSAVPRCHSINSLAFNGSQFQPKSLSYSQDVLPLPPSSPRHNSAQRASRHNDMRSISTNEVHYRPGVEYFDEMIGSESRLCRMSASPITSRRRSLVPVPVHNSPALGCQEMRHPSSSSKKVAVAPQQHVGRADSHSANRQAMVATHHVAPMQRKSSNAMPNERLVDGGSLRTQEDESSLNQRVKYLESELRRISKTQAVTSSPTAYPMPYGGVATQPELALILSEKNMKIEDLTHQVEHLSAQLRHEQRVYQKKVEELKRDRQTARAELDSFVKKLDHLSDRYVKYDKDLEEKYSKLQEEHAKAVAQLNEKERILSDLQNNVVRYEETTDFVGKQNNELHELLDAREKEVDELREEIKHLQLDLDHKDKKINDQNGTIATLSAEASSHVSTSSGSAPQGFDDDEDSSSASYNRTHRQYSKAHSTLGVSPGNGLYQERTNLRKSLSNFALNAIKSDVVTAGMSQNLRKERATIAECRMLNVALKDALKCLQKRDNRMIPSILSILKRAEETDFANSDEDEGLQTDSRVMTVGEAETYVGQKLRALKELHGDLEQMRETTIDILETSQDANFF